MNVLNESSSSVLKEISALLVLLLEVDADVISEKFPIVLQKAIQNKFIHNIIKIILSRLNMI